MSAEEPIFHEVVGDVMSGLVPKCSFNTALDLVAQAALGFGLGGIEWSRKVGEDGRISFANLYEVSLVYWPLNPHTSFYLKDPIA